MRFDSSGDLVDGLYRVGDLVSGWKACVLNAVLIDTLTCKAGH